MHTAEKKTVIKAIGDLGRRVTAADVATKTGMPLLVAQQELNRVASETNGHLQVGSGGDIVYTFAPGFSNAYLAHGIKAAVLLVAAKLFEIGFYILRISFGIALILSLIIVIVLLVAIVMAMLLRGGSNRDDRDGGFGGFGDWGFGGGGFHFTFWDWMILHDIFSWNRPRYQRAVRYDYNAPTIRERPRSNFLLNCFSFLFGDGDPNEGLEEKRWQVIAQVIKRNRGVVTAEQLAPYTGANPKDEDAVLPVLVRFNGTPEVTAKGQLVYVFESLQTTAADQQIDPPQYLQEFPWKFSNVPDGELLPVYIVAGLNLAGAWTVWNFFSHLRLEQASEIIAVGGGNLLILVNVLLVYAIAFVGIPIIRAVINSIRNKGIDARNLERFRYAQMVQHPSVELTEKLVEAHHFKVREKRISERDVVFTTESDSRDQADELSEQFTKMENQRQKGPAAPKKKSDSKAKEDDVVDMTPSDDETEDGGRIINIKQKKHQEFDASP